MSIVESLQEEFAEHDVFLHLLLGLVSVARRSEQVVPPTPPAPRVEPSSVLDTEEERRVMLLLGVLSVRRSLLGTVEPLRAASFVSRTIKAEASTNGLPPGFDLLR